MIFLLEIFKIDWGDQAIFSALQLDPAVFLLPGFLPGETIANQHVSTLSLFDTRLFVVFSWTPHP